MDHYVRYSEERAALLKEKRKEFVQARENWLEIKKLSSDNREMAKFAKEEASECLKYERALTQVIETLEGKRPSPGDLKGDDRGGLSYRTPPELERHFDYAYALCDGRFNVIALIL